MSTKVCQGDKTTGPVYRDIEKGSPCERRQGPPRVVVLDDLMRRLGQIAKFFKNGLVELEGGRHWRLLVLLPIHGM